MTSTIKNITARLQANSTQVTAADSKFKENGAGIYVINGEVKLMTLDQFQDDEDALSTKWDGYISGYDTRGEACCVVYKGKIKKISDADSYRQVLTFVATKLNLSGSKLKTNAAEDDVTYIFSKGDTHTVIAIDND